MLNGPTLSLRELHISDAAPLVELLTDAQVCRYISAPPPSPRHFERFIALAHAQRADGRGVCFAVVPEGLKEPVGMFQVRSLDATFKLAEWGFVLGRPFWGTGLFHEAAVLVLEFAFRTVGVHRIEARAVVNNGRGNRVLERLGAKGEAVLHKAFNRHYKQFLWAIIAEEWSRPTLTPGSFDAVTLQLHIQKTVAAQVWPPHQPAPDGPLPFFLTDIPKPESEDGEDC